MPKPAPEPSEDKEVERLRRQVVEQRDQVDKLTKQVDEMAAQLKARAERPTDAKGSA